MFTIVSALVFLLLFIVWSNNGKNIYYKFIFACLAVWGFWILLGSPRIHAP
jgi:hypothetical protein